MSMETCFNRWEKDPFFPAAEEVQESADRMESAYRRWIHENGSNDVSGELLRDLHTALGTAKWQLEELDRAVKSNDDACVAGEDTRARHGQFVDTIGKQIVAVENSLKESNREKGETAHPWVRLDLGERDELAIFLSCAAPELGKQSNLPVSGEKMADLKGGRAHGHRRTASAYADMSSWKISLPIDDSSLNLPPPKVSSFSCLTKVLESSSKVNLSKNGFRKWKGGDQHQHDNSETICLRNHQLSRGCNACYERSRSCLSCCGDEVDDKQLYGWFGALQRQLQRSQYQIQYGRPVQMLFCAIIVFLLIVNGILVLLVVPYVKALKTFYWRGISWENRTCISDNLVELQNLAVSRELGIQLLNCGNIKVPSSFLRPWIQMCGDCPLSRAE